MVGERMVGKEECRGIGSEGVDVRGGGLEGSGVW